MIVALEGHSYSGKTTLLNYLKDTRDKKVIAEHDIYAGGIDNYPPFPPTNFQMSKNNVDFFANLEAKRAQDTAKYKQELVFFDRSFMSVILFQKFLKSLALPGQFEAYDYAKSTFVDLLKKEDVVFPDLLVFMSCESEEDYQKRQVREISVSLLRSREALEFFTNEYKNICSIFEKYGRLQKFTSKNGKQSLEENSRCLSILQNSPIPKPEKQHLITEIMESI